MHDSDQRTFLPWAARLGAAAAALLLLWWACASGERPDGPAGAPDAERTGPSAPPAEGPPSRRSLEAPTSDAMPAGSSPTPPSAAPAGTVTVTGTVVDWRDEPVPDAEIRLWVLHGRHPPGEPRSVGRSDARGAFRIAGLEEDSQLGARKKGMAPSARQFARAESPVLKLVLPEPAARLSGTVLHGGTPVADASVAIVYESFTTARYPSLWSGPGGHHLRTDAAGKFLVEELAAGKVRVIARKAGFVTGDTWIDARTDRLVEVAITLAAGWGVEGLVRDAAGAPLAGVAVQVEGDTAETRRAVSKADGTYRVDEASSPPSLLRFVKPGFAEARLPLAWRDVAERTQVRDATLVALPRITGRVEDERGGALAGCEIDARGPLRGQRFVTASDAGGRFEVAGAPGVRYRLLVRERRGVPLLPCPQLGEVEIGARDVLIVIAERDRATASLHGILLGEDGTPLANAPLVVREHDAEDQPDPQPVAARSQADGTFRLGPLPARPWRVVCGSLDGRFPRVEFGVQQLAPNEDKDLGELRVPTLGRLVVDLRDAEGKEPPSAHVQVLTAAREVAAVLDLAGGSGEGRLVPGEYRADVVASGFVTQWANPVVIRAGGRTTLARTLQRGMRRELAITLPDPAAAGRSCRLVLRRPDGTSEESTFAAEVSAERPIRYVFMVMLGAHHVEITGETGRRYVATFTVTSLEPARDWLALRAEART